MKRWIATIFAALCLLVCIGAGGLWVMTEFRVVSGVGVLGSHYVRFRAVRGKLLMEFHRQLTPDERLVSLHFRSLEPLPLNDADFGAAHQWLGIGYGVSAAQAVGERYITARMEAVRQEMVMFEHDPDQLRMLQVELDRARNEMLAYTPYMTLQVPCWLVMLATAITPGQWIVRRRREKWRARIGHCPDCGYDLRATPDRCPECGRETGTHLQGAS